MSVAIYVRVSTGLQIEGTSLDKQIELCKQKAHELGFSDAHLRIYREEGYSGEDIDIRPEMTRLREDMANGLISHVICAHPDRLSRDMTDKLIICREFDRNGVELLFTDTDFEKSPEGILFFNIISAIAAYELALIRKRTVRGREKAVKDLKKIMPMRVAPYGYELKDGKLFINDEEAKFVKMIYEWYVYENLTMRDIGEGLYRLGATPKRGESKNWSASSIGRILTSEIYIGKYYYNRRATKKIKGQTTASGNPRKTYDIRNEEEWIRVDIPAIVDTGLYELAQQHKERNTKNKHVGNQKYQYLLKGLIKCGYCGRTWDATTYSGRVDKATGERMRYRCYRCPNLNPKRYGPEIEKCYSQSLRAELIEDYVWNEVERIVTTPEEFLTYLKSKNGEEVEGVNETISVLEMKIGLKEKEKEKVKIMFKHEVIGEEEMVHDLALINKEITTIQNELRKYRTHIENQMKEELTLERVYEMVNLIREKLKQEDELTFEVKRNIVETLFDEIILKFNGEEVMITSVGAFDQLNLARNDVGVHTQPQEV